MKLLILAFYLCVIVLVEDGSSLPQRPIVGDYSPISVNDDEVKQLVRFSLTDFLTDFVRDSYQISIVSAKSKVVAVKNYKIKLTACKQGSSNEINNENSLRDENDCHLCEVTLWEQPWLNKTTETESLCVVPLANKITGEPIYQTK